MRRFTPLSILMLAAACGPKAMAPDALKADLLARRERDQVGMVGLASHWRDTAYRRSLDSLLATNAQWLDTIVRRQGWPTRDAVGEDAQAAAFVIAQHADAVPGAQQRLLDALRPSADKGEVKLHDLAYLEDKVRKSGGRPQLYGTMVSYDAAANPVVPLVEDPANLDARRARMGLSTMADYLAQIREANEKLRKSADRKP